jgi:hypothetical protein
MQYAVIQILNVKNIDQSARERDVALRLQHAAMDPCSGIEIPIEKEMPSSRSERHPSTVLIDKIK